MPGAYTRGRDQLHTSEWRGDQSQVCPQDALSSVPVSAFLLRRAQSGKVLHLCLYPLERFMAGWIIAECVYGY